MALLPWRKGIVTGIEKHTYNTRRFFIEALETDHFDFKPGQFVTLDLPIHEKPNKRLRSYSIASAPDGSAHFELLIVQAKNGQGTDYLFNTLQVGDTLDFRGPQGAFTLPAKLDKDLFLICTGTGIAPFRSMVQHIQRSGIPHKNIYLVYGCRTRADLLYPEELKQLEMDIPGFHYAPTLSRDNWKGRKGYVHPVYEVFSQWNQPAYFYLCGWKDMIDEAKNRILDMGYTARDIHAELYG